MATRDLITIDIPDSNITSISFSSSEKPDIIFAINFKKIAKILKYSTISHRVTIQQLHAQHKKDVNIVGYDPKFNFVGTSDNDETKLWDASKPTERCKTTIRNQMFLAFYPNSMQTIMVTKSESYVNFYEFKGETKKPNSILEISHRNNVNCIAFYLFKGKNRFILATGCQDNIILWNINSSNWSYEEIATLTGHRRDVNSLAFYPDPDEPILASGSEDNTTKIWRQSPDSTWECVETLGKTGNGKSLAFYPTRPFLATGSNDNKNINIWQFDKTSNRTKLNQVIRRDKEVTSFNIHPTEAILAIAFDAKI
jgi:WD40 repeat protein